MILKPIEFFYHLLVNVKNYAYDIKIKKQFKTTVPIVSVGNLSFGGVGKTPCVIFLAKEFATEYKKIVIVTKSYKAKLTSSEKVNIQDEQATMKYGDEACLIQTALPHVQVWSGPSKAASVLASLDSKPDLVIVDDGFSHRQLSRNFDLVLIDATAGINTYLREPMSSLKRASAVIITKTNLATELAVSKIKNNVIAAAPHLQNLVFEAESKTQIKLSLGAEIMVFCGLGRPQSLILDLEKQGYKVLKKIFYADHFLYTKMDEEKILNAFLDIKNKNPNLQLVTTEKDFIKLNSVDLKKYLHTTQHEMLINKNKKEIFEKIRKSF